MQENAAPQTITAYPNPTNGLLYVNASRDVLSYRLIDITGRICLEQQNDPNAQLALDLSAWPKGVYTLQAQTANGPIQHTKIVVR